MLAKLLKNISPKYKGLLHSFGRRIGLEINLSAPSARDDLRLISMLTTNGVERVLDIGANRGQFAETLFNGHYSGEIISFEPLPNAHLELTKKSALRRDAWIIAPRVAVSNKSGVASFNLNHAEATSSLLSATDDASNAAPGILSRQEINVLTRRLDDIVKELSLTSRRTFIKIDVQGGEGLVLAGASAALDEVSGLMIELSLKELYVDQPLALDILNPLLARGFEIYDIFPGFRDPQTLRLYQIDVVLFHPNRIGGSGLK